MNQVNPIFNLETGFPEEIASNILDCYVSLGVLPKQKAEIVLNFALSYINKTQITSFARICDTINYYVDISTGFGANKYQSYLDQPIGQTNRTIGDQVIHLDERIQRLETQNPERTAQINRILEHFEKTGKLQAPSKSFAFNGGLSVIFGPRDINTDPLGYFQSHEIYQAMRRSDLYHKDRKLYDLLSRQGLLDTAIPESHSGPTLSHDEILEVQQAHKLCKGNMAEASRLLGRGRNTVAKYWATADLKSFMANLTEEDKENILQMHSRCNGNGARVSSELGYHPHSVYKTWKSQGKRAALRRTKLTGTDKLLIWISRSEFPSRSLAAERLGFTNYAIQKEWRALEDVLNLHYQRTIQGEKPEQAEILKEFFLARDIVTDPVRYFRSFQSLKSLSRTQLQRADRKLYDILRDQDKLDDVFPEKRARRSDTGSLKLTQTQIDNGLSDYKLHNGNATTAWEAAKLGDPNDRPQTVKGYLKLWRHFGLEIQEHSTSQDKQDKINSLFKEAEGVPTRATKIFRNKFGGTCDKGTVKKYWKKKGLIR